MESINPLDDKITTYMATQTEIDQARAWLKANRSQIPPVLPDQIGSRIRIRPGRFVPVVSFNEDNAGLANHQPNASGHESLLPWPGLTAVENTTNLRPVEDQIDS